MMALNIFQSLSVTSYIFSSVSIKVATSLPPMRDQLLPGGDWVPVVAGMLWVLVPFVVGVLHVMVADLIDMVAFAQGQGMLTEPLLHLPVG